MTQPQIDAHFAEVCREHGLSSLSYTYIPAQPWEGAAARWFAYRAANCGSGPTVEAAIADLRKQSNQPTPDPVPMPSLDHPTGGQVNMDRNADTYLNLK